MRITTKLTFASSLIAEVLEEVYANYGSPPFPNVADLESAEQHLNKYLTDNRVEIDKLDDV